MIRTIVVPVDRAEETKPPLNIAAWLALLLGARVRLLGISSDTPLTVREIHPPHGDITLLEGSDLYRERLNNQLPYPLYLQEKAETPVEEVTFSSEEEQDLENYLAHLQEELTGSYLHYILPPGRVSSCIEKGPVAQALKDLAREEQIDLVVLPAHRENVLHQLLFSSQPNRVLRQDQLPVLVVPENFKLSTLKQFMNDTLLVNLKLYLKSAKSHLLLTLDGTTQAEAALPLAAELASKMKVQLYLLLVLPLDNRKVYSDPETGQPFKVEADPVEQYAYANKYLCHVQQGLADRGINCRRIILEGKPEERIIETIEKTRPILTILATHAYPRMEQVLLGNIAEKVIKECNRLVLLVPNWYQFEPEEEFEAGESIESEELQMNSRKP